MRIVITSNYKLGNETGTAHIAEKLSEYLSKNHQVTYICLGNKYYLSKLNNNLNILTIPSVVINKISIPLITPDVVYKIFVYLNKFKPDVVHSQNSLFVSNLVQIWANLNHVPFIVTFHHIPTEAINHLFPKLSKNILANLVQDLYKDISLAKFIDNSDGVIALNNFVLKSVKKINKAVPIKIINNGLDLTKLLKIKSKNKLSDIVNFVFVGSYSERKNQEFLINTFANLPTNYLLHLYGNKKTGSEYVKILNNLIKKLRLKNVFINDYSKDIVSIYKKSDFFVSASLKEAQSLAVIEALACGNPVIGLENETLNELINNNNGIKFSQSITYKEFANEIQRFIKRINYSKISKYTRKSIDKFKIENVALKIEKVYKTTTSRNSNNGRGNISKYYQEIFKRIVIKK